RVRPQRHARPGPDARRGRPLRRRARARGERGQPAREGDRPPPRYGRRADAPGRQGRGGRRPPHRLAAQGGAGGSRGARDLRRPPHGDGAGRRRRAPPEPRDQGPSLREQDLPALLRRLPRPLGGGAIMTAMDAGTRPIITLDGPAASGKSSAAKAVAARLGIAYVSSGLLYRAVTLLALREG